jgi:hypothetical protein
MTTMTTKIPDCPVKDHKRKNRPVKWLRQKVVSGYPAWKCLACDKVSDDNHLQTRAHKSKLAYYYDYPLWYPDSEDERYAELWKQEEEEDERARAEEEEEKKRAIAEEEEEKKRAIAAGQGQTPSPVATGMEAAWAAHAAAEPEPTPSSVAAWMEGARAAPAAPKAAPPPLSQASSSSAGGPGSTSSSASAWMGRAHEAGSAPTAEQTAVPAMPKLRLIFENSKKIQQLVRQVNELSAQNAELASLVFRESHVS